MEWAGKRVLVIGLGRSGLSAARWLTRAGARVTVNDLRREAELNPRIVEEVRSLGARLQAGAHRREDFLETDRIVISPGVPLDIPHLAEARALGIPVLGEMELAARHMEIPLLAVTGTNGKSTATALLGAIVERAGFRVFVGGNIGRPLTDYLIEGTKADVAVIEVSSFQLDTSETLCPAVSLLLNISPDHLDRYADYEAYAASKLRILRNQGQGHYAVLNDDDPRLARCEPPAGVTVLRYGLKAAERRQAFVHGEAVRVHMPDRPARDFDLDRFGLPGLHNRENLMGAILAALAWGANPQAVQETVDVFQGLPHRLEKVGEMGGVDFYDDSKATNVEAALRSMTGFDRPVVLIAGGRHKGADYAPLVRAAQGKVRQAVFLGESRGLLAEAFEGMVSFRLVENMEEAVVRAYAAARPGDAVLLAPACSSFDMFADYAHRGRVFREAVRRLHHDR